MTVPHGFIDLDRGFEKLGNSLRPEDSAVRSYFARSLRSDSTLRWDELLSQKLVVVLGEPGSGKSWEFRHRCAALQQQGEFAFLVELERLVSGTLD